MSFILTLIAGLSTILGSFIIFIKPKNINKLIQISLSFAIGVMVSISIFDLIPESYNLLNTNKFLKIIYLLININIGIILSIYLDKTIKIDNKLYRVGVITFIAIILHNIPEGIITYLVSSYDTHLGLSITASISLHNIPEGISISLPIYYASKSFKKAFIYTSISGLSEVVGALLAHILLKDIINNTLISIMLGITAGIMLYISLFELLKEVKQYKSRGVTLLSIIIGFLIMILSHLLIK